MIYKIYRVIINRRAWFLVWLVILGFPIGFLLWNLPRYNGPAILRDEVGYLVNAIFLAGYHTDGGSSYHIGFSLLLAPLFLLFSDTSTIWIGAMVLNSLLWIVTFYLTDKLITNWDAGVSLSRRVMVLLGIGLYPAWVTMSGYEFTTSAFVALFMIGLVSFINAIKNNGRGIYFFTVYVGFLYWIHPIGLMASGASVIAIGVWVLQDKRRFAVWFSHTIGCIFIFVLYKFEIHPFILNSMTPAGYFPLTHYPRIFDILNKMQDAFFWGSLVIHALGQASYLLIGSLGGALFGIYNLLQYITITSRETYGIWRKIAGIYLIGSLLGVILIGAVNFSLIEPEIQRSDQWIYGRYLDNVDIPILVIGMLSLMRKGW